MKRLVESDGSEGLESLIGEYVVLWCINFIYSGRLIGVGEHDTLLTDACVVYQTGELDAKEWKNAQALPTDHYIRNAAIESYGRRGW
jgi:hypothetical protein